MRSRSTPWLCARAVKFTLSTSAWMMCSSPAALARACSADATAGERERFATLWQDRVREILAGTDGKVVEILRASG